MCVCVCVYARVGVCGCVFKKCCLVWSGWKDSHHM